MTINDRFKMIINNLYSGNKRAFSNAIGVSPTVIENIVGKRQGNPSFEVTQKLLFANANINAEWLMTGQGNMFSSKKTYSETKTTKSIVSEPEAQYESLDSITSHVDDSEKLLKDVSDSILSEKDGMRAFFQILDDNSKLVDANVKLANANLLLAENNVRLAQRVMDYQDMGKGGSCTADAV